MSDAAPIIPAPKRGYSVARVTRAWYVACHSGALGAKPLPVTILDTPLVLFRDEDGQPSALLDRCAHRNVPLSMGAVEGGQLVCGYHGWTFDREGACQRVPALCGVQTGKGRRVPRFFARESQGFVWVYMDPDHEPEVGPYQLPHLDEPGFATVRYDAEVPATLHATCENILDVPHTAFLHRGLFRGVKRNEITAVVRREADRVSAEFIGEPRPTGLIGSILAPQGGTVTHFDRFILPSIAQVEYGLADRHRVIATSALTPVSDFVTKLFAVVTFKTIVPAFLLRLVATPIAMRVLKQDVVMLQAQTDVVQRFEGEQFVSTDVDLLGGHIWRLLKQAERGDKPTEPVEQRVQLLA
ncbi:MAG: aromatic ring-hydroxylating dioxygenase subunit alpha [Deltaproteobacteria bacterium]